jgi:hypothetical protein
MAETHRLPGRRPYVPEGEKMIPHNFTIHPRHMALLRARAHARRVPLSAVLREVLDAWANDQEAQTPPQPGTGAELVAELNASGFIGAWENRTDIGDSVEFARRLRERVESRADRHDADEIERLGEAHPAGTAGD